MELVLSAPLELALSAPPVEGRDYFIRPPVEDASSAYHRSILVFIFSLMSCKIIDGLLNGVFIGGPLAINSRIAYYFVGIHIC